MPAVKKEKHDSKSKMKICGQNKVKEAVNALKLLNKKFVEKDLKKKPLLEDTAESNILLQLMLKKIPPPQLIRMIRVPLPHSLVTETSEVCLITGDLEKRNHKAEVEPTVLHYKDLLRKHGVTKVSQVIPLRQLRTEYKTFESKRQLIAAYDVFLVDKKIAGLMAKTLGKSSFQSRKFPIQIDMRSPNLKDQIDKALCQTEFSLTCRGNSYALEVARLSMEDEAIIENIKTCIEILENKLPGNRENILSLYLKTAKSKAIPIYVSLDIPDDILIKKPRKNDKYKLDELSTIDNAEVKVFRDGRVILRKIKKESSSCEDAAENDKKMNLNEPFTDDDLMESEEDTQESISNEGSLKKNKKNASDVIEITNYSETKNEEDIQGSTKASRKKRKSKKSADLIEVATNTAMENEEDNQDSTANKVSPKKKKKGKKYAKVNETTDIVEMENEEIQDSVTAEISLKKKKKGRKSILDQVSDKTEMKSEEETQNSPSRHAYSKKKNKKNRNSNYVEADEAVKDVQESSMLLNSKKRKIHQSDNVTEKAQKDKKRKVSESDKNMKSKTHKNISEVAEEDINVETILKSKKGKKKAKDVDTAKKESSFISIEGDEFSHDEKTPLRSKKNKKVKKENTEDSTASVSLTAKGKKADVDSNVNNSLTKLNKRRKSNRKGISVF